jgi:hypothetical protein
VSATVDIYAPAMRHPRYEVHSVTGYPITQGWKRARDQRAGTTYFIADTWDCYREVRLLAFPGSGHDEVPSGLTTTRRSTIERNCARLNREADEVTPREDDSRARWEAVSGEGEDAP